MLSLNRLVWYHIFVISKQIKLSHVTDDKRTTFQGADGVTGHADLPQPCVMWPAGHGHPSLSGTAAGGVPVRPRPGRFPSVPATHLVWWVLLGYNMKSFNFVGTYFRGLTMMDMAANTWIHGFQILLKITEYVNKYFVGILISRIVLLCPTHKLHKLNVWWIKIISQYTELFWYVQVNMQASILLIPLNPYNFWCLLYVLAICTLR